MKATWTQRPTGPALSKAREAAHKAECLSNLHQIGLAMIMYTNDSRGLFPGSARCNLQKLDDIVYWEQPRGAWDITGGNRPPISSLHATSQQDEDLGALSRYMGKHFTAGPWICPSDPLNRPKAAINVGSMSTTPVPYPYSYVMNDLLSAELPQFDPSSYAYFGSRVAKMAAIKHSFSTVMMLEESENTMDDGDFTVVGIYGPAPTWTIVPGGLASSQLNWLAVRHDSRRRMPDNILRPGDQENIPNSAASGNVVFCDGHADYLTRQYVGSPTLRHWDWRF